MEDAGALKKWMYARAMDVARRVGQDITDGKPVGAFDRLKWQLGNLFIYGPLRNTLGLSRVRVAYTAGEAIGPDLFAFYRSIGTGATEVLLDECRAILRFLDGASE